MSLFNVRSAILEYLAHTESKSDFVREVVTFAVTFILFLVEILAPRPSQFSSRSKKAAVGPDGVTLAPAPEMNASLFALATFSYVDSFMIASAFPTAKQPSLTMDVVPDLRPDDKTARVLLSCRSETSMILDVHQLMFILFVSRPPRRRPPQCRSWSWHESQAVGAHRPPLLALPSASPRAAVLVLYKIPSTTTISSLAHVSSPFPDIRVAVVALPPLFLQGILGHINKRQRGEDAPLHVALLYAGGLFFFQILGALAASQSLFIGRRICVRLRCVVSMGLFLYRKCQGQLISICQVNHCRRGLHESAQA